MPAELTPSKERGFWDPSILETVSFKPRHIQMNLVGNKASFPAQDMLGFLSSHCFTPPHDLRSDQHEVWKLGISDPELREPKETIREIGKPMPKKLNTYLIQGSKSRT